jgi:hypothetical protein
MRRRIITALALASLLTLAIGLTAAEATRTVKLASHISIKSNGLKFSGKVTSSNAACDGGRKVTLFRKAGHLKLGTATTNAAGKWKITVSGFAGVSLGHFSATVKRRSEGTAGTIYICKGATSPTIAFHQ